MADAMILGFNMSTLGSGALGIVSMIFLTLVVGGIIFLAFILYKNNKRYKQFKVIIWQRDGFGQLYKKYDDAGVFVDKKTQNKRLFLRKNNVGLCADSIPFIPDIKGNRTIYLFQTGLKNFHFIKINIENPGITLSVGEEDVNWGINAYERQKKLFSQNQWLQYLPFIALAFVSIIILAIFIYFFKNFAVLKDVAIALEHAASSMAQAKAGTLVVTP